MAGGGWGVQGEQFEALRAEVAGMEDGMAGRWARGEVRGGGDGGLCRECLCSLHTDGEANVYE